MYRRLALTLLIGTSAALVAQPIEPAAPLIERTKLFGNPSQMQARLSPDGRWLAWIAPKEGVLNIWVAPAANPTQARALTSEKKRPIEQHFWAPNSSMILFVNDEGGDENFRLYGVDVRTGAQKTLTPFDKTRAEVVAISNLVPDRILVGLNNRDPRWHDVHSLDLKSGKLTPVMMNDGYASFVADRSLNLRVASRARADGGTDFFRIVDGKVEPQPFSSVSLDDAMTTRPLSFTSDGKTLYWVDSRNRNTAAVVAQDVTTGATRVLAEDRRADVGDIIVNPILVDPETGRMQAYLVNYLRSTWVPTDTEVADGLKFLEERLGGEITVTSRTLSDDKWTVEVDRPSASPTTYLYDANSKKLLELFVSRPELAPYRLADVHPIEIKTRDGLVLPSYLSLPPDSDANNDGRPENPAPMVLLVHGGPWIRDSYGFDPYRQWLANRGYAVLSVNFRGSSGFGKKFLSAGDQEWGRKMHHDLLDAVEWAQKAGITTKGKVAIMGGSYGGYATLVGLSSTPETFACGVDMVGPSNLITLLESTPPHWESLKKQLFQRIGNPTTEAGRQLLRERSPLTRASAITKPLLIAQGANDPRVKKAEADQIVAAMAANNIPVTYLLFPDEGHGFVRPENTIAFGAIAENFLARCLNGRAQPIGDALRGSSVQVPHGAEFAPGLKAALAANQELSASTRP